MPSEVALQGLADFVFAGGPIEPAEWFALQRRDFRLDEAGMGTNLHSGREGVPKANLPFAG